MTLARNGAHSDTADCHLGKRCNCRRLRIDVQLVHCSEPRMLATMVSRCRRRQACIWEIGGSPERRDSLALRDANLRQRTLILLCASSAMLCKLAFPAP